MMGRHLAHERFKWVRYHQKAPFDKAVAHIYGIIEAVIETVCGINPASAVAILPGTACQLEAMRPSVEKRGNIGIMGMMDEAFGQDGLKIADGIGMAQIGPKDQMPMH